MLRAQLTGVLTALACGAIAATALAQDSEGSSPTAEEIFNQRIMPIFRSPNPSSCVQCHLAAVDLKNYILPSHEKTFVSLRDQGLIDLDRPEQSKIVTLIRMGEKDLDKGARLIHAKMRNAEYGAFVAWIKACCADPRLRNLPSLAAAERAGPERPDAVIRHARKSRVVDSFVRNVWSQRMRCFPCHTPHEIDPSNPRQHTAVKKLQEFKEQYPELVDRMKLFDKTPETTLDLLIEKSSRTPDGEIPIINLDDPKNSLLLIKPMSKLPNKRDDGTFEAPSYAQPVSHMGGLKMHRDDQSYKSFVAWLEDYANVVGNRYASVDELPTDNWHGTNLVLRIVEAPEAWPAGIPVQLFVHAWNEPEGAWESEPIAFTQGTVTPRRMVNGSLFLFTPKDPDNRRSLYREPPSLPRGKFLVKAFVDFGSRLAGDPTLLLGAEDYYGQAELRRPRWREGFLHAETVAGKLLNKQ